MPKCNAIIHKNKAIDEMKALICEMNHSGQSEAVAIAEILTEALNDGALDPGMGLAIADQFIEWATALKKIARKGLR